MKRLKQILVLVVAVLGVMSCNLRPVKCDGLNAIINDTSESMTVYNGLKLGITSQEEDLIIKNDTSSYSLNRTGLYRYRQVKSVEKYRNSSELSKFILTELMGFNENDFLMSGFSYFERRYWNRIQDYKKELKEEPPFNSKLLDYYLEDSYRGDIIIDFNNNDGEREYKAITGWYSYQTFKDTVYSVTCVFDEDNIKPEEISDYMTGFQNVLIKKYGDPNVSKPYFGDNLEICVFLPDTTGKANDDLYWDLYKPVKHLGLKILDSSFWMKGKYEIQLFINESNRYHSEYGTEYGNYEFIIRYVDNKFLIRHIEEMEKVKKQKNEQFEQNNQKLEIQRQTELINAQKNQHI